MADIDGDRIMKETAASNAAGLADAIAEAEAALAKMRSAKAAFEAAQTWHDFASACVDAKEGFCLLPSRAHVSWRLNEDPL